MPPKDKQIRLEIQRRYRSRHREQLRLDNIEYRLRNQEKTRAYYRLNQKRIRERAKVLHQRKKHNPDYIAQREQSRVKYAAMLKEAAINIYSDGMASCKWCKIADMDVLCLDHIDGNGNSHRKSMRTSTYSWLKRHDYPPGFQVLCMNCNWKKRLKGSVIQ